MRAMKKVARIVLLLAAVLFTLKAVTTFTAMIIALLIIAGLYMLLEHEAEAEAEKSE